MNENGALFSFVRSIGQGVDFNERVGRDILVHRISYSGYVRVTSTGNPGDPEVMENVRHIRVIDKQPDISGLGPSTGQLFHVQTGQNVTDMMREIEYYKWFKIMYDKVWRLHNNYTQSQGQLGFFTYSGVPAYKYFKFHVKFKRPIKVTFSDLSTDAQQIKENDILVGFWGPDTSAVADEFYPQLTSLTQRTVYSDA